MEVLDQILTRLHLVTRDDIGVLRIILALTEFISILEVGDGPIEVNLIEHDLLLRVILLLRLFLLHILHTLLSRNGDLAIHIVLDLLLIDNDGVGVILDGLVISS